MCFHTLKALAVVHSKVVVLLLLLHCLLSLSLFVAGFVFSPNVLPAKSDSEAIFCLRLLSKH